MQHTQSKNKVFTNCAIIINYFKGNNTRITIRKPFRYITSEGCYEFAFYLARKLLSATNVFLRTQLNLIFLSYLL